MDESQIDFTHILDIMHEDTLSAISLRVEGCFEAINEEGLFDASRLANPMLPQYHPKQLIELLNAGKTKRVKAILLHVIRSLKNRKASMPNLFARGAPMRKMSRQESSCRPTRGDRSPILDSVGGVSQRRLSRLSSVSIDDNRLDYDELDSLSPLPLYALFAADMVTSGSQKAVNMERDGNDFQQQNYDSLFNDAVGFGDGEELDEALLAEEFSLSQNPTASDALSQRTRHSSIASEAFVGGASTSAVAIISVPTNFTMTHR